MASTNRHKIMRLEDYKTPTFILEKTELEFDLDEKNTKVKARLTVKDNESSEFLLNGSKFLTLVDIKVDGNPAQYEIDEDFNLTVKNAPKNFVLETEISMNPSENTTCMGLYISGGMFTTQCESEGFRNITFYPDRPDVLTKFTVTIRADGDKFNSWLSNGNLVFQNKLEDGRMQTVWEDPFPKPSYLFALVVGNLGHIEDSFLTMSGKKVNLHLYCERGKETKLSFAMEALKKAMRWDEEKFGREYDLDIFNIVAVSSFIFGAMENKSLNIFNDTALLADKDSATDGNYKRIDGIIAHEYFHNWSGNRVTVQNWFELSLKEGFTVYRDQQYSSDQYSPVIQRIEDVEGLRTYQFSEDNGPLSHPVRANEYIDINNFYTSTVYEKGAEIIRMYETLLGWEDFRKACDLYFKRFDGKAVSINDFAGCMEEISGKDLTQFKLWYTQNGTPRVKVKTDFSGDIFTVRIKQSQKKFSEPLVIPLQYGLLDKEGKELKSGTIILDDTEQVFNFDGFDEEPTLSINRGFSAPVKVEISYTQAQKELLIKYDTDLFNRYDIGQQYALDMLLQDRLDKDFISIFGSYLDLFGKDNEFVSQAIMLPATKYVTDFMSEVDYDKLIEKRENISKMFAMAHQDKLYEVYKELDTQIPYSLSGEAIANRSLKGIVLYYLCLTEKGKELAVSLYEKADNLTDKMIALSSLRHADISAFDECMADFYEKNKDNNLVVLKWLALEASADRDDALARNKGLLEHEAFDIKNPNKVRYLIGSFAGNLKHFHAKDGSGYKFVADMVLDIDKLNPSVASGLAKSFNQVAKLDSVRKGLMMSEINRILAEKISSGTREILEKIISE